MHADIPQEPVGSEFSHHPPTLVPSKCVTIPVIDC